MLYSAGTWWRPSPTA